LGAYTASKHAVIGLTRSAALEYAAKGIRINVVCPGSTDTPMVANALANEPETMKAVMKEIPMGRLGKAEEIASAVLWLCSPGAGFMTGQVIVPDGGYTVR
jgi:NAD(P)-dependent dehydrogenase (short-subunit alcohol dehydrogenase family)